MKFYEHEAADIFEEAGIPVPDRLVVKTPEDAIAAAVHLAAVVVKARCLRRTRPRGG